MLNWILDRFVHRESSASLELGEALSEYTPISEPEPNWKERALTAESMVNQLRKERRELFTVKEVNEHTESVVNALKEDNGRLRDGILGLRNVAGLLLGAKPSLVDINTAWHEIEKKSSQSVMVREK